MTGRGRASADAIAHAAVARAASAARAAGGASACPPDLCERFAAVARACEHLSDGPYGLPRDLGLAGIVTLRALASNLRAAACGSGAGAERGGFLGRSIELHQLLDQAATALGAAPSCFADPDDWSLPDEAEPVAMLHLAPTARTAALVCHGLDELAAPAGARSGLIRRDAAVLLGGVLVLQAACGDPDGIPPIPARALARRTREAAERIAAAAAGWRAAEPEARLGRLGAAIEGSGRLAADVLADLVEPRRAPAP